jgi:Holliday junction resolvase RusA-like endonuclease
MSDTPIAPSRNDFNEMFYFEVPGPFGVKGSTFSFRDPRDGTIRTKTDAKHGKSFAAAVRWAAKNAGVTMIPKGRGVTVSVIYGFARPKGRDRARAEPCVRPDVDKLCRSLMDALTGIAYHDDGQVVGLSVRKIYADKLIARVVVMAEPLEKPDAVREQNQSPR